MIAPTLPLAAHNPWHVDRYLVGKLSLGSKNVVVLGPKFWKKLARMNRNKKTLASEDIPVRLGEHCADEEEGSKRIDETPPIKLM